MSEQNFANTSLNRAQPFLIRSLSILTIDRPAFITNRTDTSVKGSSASVGAHFRHFPFEEVDKTQSPRRGGRGRRGQHLIRHLAQPAPDFLQPVQMFRLHEHGTKAGNDAVLVLVRPRSRRKEFAGYLSQGEMEVFLGRSGENLLR